MRKFANSETEMFESTYGDYWFYYVNDHIAEEPSVTEPMVLAEIMRDRLMDKIKENKTNIPMFDELALQNFYAINFYEVAKSVLSEVVNPA
jgi:hypothetical protein